MSGHADMKRVYKDYVSLVNNLNSTFDGQVILSEDALDGETLTLLFTVKPNEGIYKDCEIGFQALLDDYPMNAPVVTPLVGFLHPNISFANIDGYDTEVCLNLFDDWHDYEDGYVSLELVIQGILFLFYEPNIDDGLAAYAVFESDEELRDAVNRTKYGTVPKSRDEMDELWDHLKFADIYKGPDPKSEVKACETDTNIEMPEPIANVFGDPHVPEKNGGESSTEYSLNPPEDNLNVEVDMSSHTVVQSIPPITEKETSRCKFVDGTLVEIQQENSPIPVTQTI